MTSTTYSSGQLEQVQGDAARSITGNAGVMDDGGISPGALLYMDFYATNGYTATGAPWNGRMRLDTSRIPPTAAENRPVNVVVRYLIRTFP